MSKITHDEVRYQFNGIKRVIKLLQRKLETIEHDEGMQIVDNYITQQEKESKLLELYKELSTIRFYLFCEKDSDLGQELMDKDTLILKQIKEIEKEIGDL